MSSPNEDAKEITRMNILLAAGWCRGIIHSNRIPDLDEFERDLLLNASAALHWLGTEYLEQHTTKIYKP